MAARVGDDVNSKYIGERLGRDNSSVTDSGCLYGPSVEIEEGVYECIWTRVVDAANQRSSSGPGGHKGLWVKFEAR